MAKARPSNAGARVSAGFEASMTATESPAWSRASAKVWPTSPPPPRITSASKPLLMTNQLRRRHAGVDAVAARKPSSCCTNFKQRAALHNSAAPIALPRARSRQPICGDQPRGAG